MSVAVTKPTRAPAGYEIIQTGALRKDDLLWDPKAETWGHPTQTDYECVGGDVSCYYCVARKTEKIIRVELGPFLAKLRGRLCSELDDTLRELDAFEAFYRNGAESGAESGGAGVLLPLSQSPDGWIKQFRLWGGKVETSKRMVP